ncbi:hypothetical protein [Streptomyces sp. NRRL S-646]|nr:hypothetical protein [Streptomyces sp. NRRL S-646]
MKNSQHNSLRRGPYGWRQWLLSALIIAATAPVAWAFWYFDRS